MFPTSPTPPSLQWLHSVWHPFSSAAPVSQDLMYQGEALLPVLRLLLLYCAVHGGVPKRHFENLR